MVEIKLATIVQFGFYSASDADDVEAAVENLYGVSGEQYGGLIMGTKQNWSRTQFTIENPDSDELSQFQRVSTYLAPDNRHVHDCITVGQFTKETIEKIKTGDTQDAQSDLRTTIDAIESFTKDIPTIPESEDAELPTVFYVEPTERLDIGWGEDGLDTDETTAWVENNQDFLRRLNIYPGHPMSLIGTEDLISPHSTGAGFIRKVTMLNTSSTFDTDREKPTLPIWLERIESALKPYYRSDYWLNYRRLQLGELDLETHGTDAILPEEMSELNAYQSTEKDLETLRKEWLDLYTKASDELEELMADTPFVDGDSVDPQREIPISPPAARGDSQQSLYLQYDDHIRKLQELVESDLDRIGNKLDRLSQFIHDSVTARASETNIELQSEVSRLTSILTLLTIVLVVFGIVEIVITV